MVYDEESVKVSAFEGSNLTLAKVNVTMDSTLTEEGIIVVARITSTPISASPSRT